MTGTLRHQILGQDMQAVEIDLDPGQTIIAEAGALILMEDGVTFEAHMSDGAQPSGQGLLGGLWDAAKRAATGAGVFLTHFTNQSNQPRKVVFGANNPGKVVPIHLGEWNGEVLCEHHSFLCATLGTRVGAALVQRFGAGVFGGTGFILQHLSGEGTVFAHACGSLLRRDLQGETIRVEPGSLVAFSTGIDYSIERAGNLKTMLFGGEGLFLATLRGQGSVLLQSLPWSRVVHNIIEQVPKK
jgi:uncharacterized protein (TIGR00266 family)